MTASRQQPRPSDRFIPWYIVLFFVAQTALFSWFIYIAKTTHTGLVTEQAYEKGLGYNHTLEKSKAQEALGFSSKILYSHGKISFLLKNKDGKPIAGATVRGVLFRPVRDGMDMNFNMNDNDGSYTAEIEPPAPGLWEIRIQAATPLGNYQTSQRINAE